MSKEFEMSRRQYLAGTSGLVAASFLPNGARAGSKKISGASGDLQNMISPANWSAEEMKVRLAENLKFSEFHDMVSSDGGIISCSTNGIASYCGADILRAGGTAADAAAAAAMVQIVFAAGGYVSFAGIWGMVYYDAKSKKTYSIDATYQIPKGETDPMSIPGFGSGKHSGRTAMVPGFFAGVEETINRFGKMPMSAIVEPAAYFAENGIELNSEVAGAMEYRKDVLSRLPETKEIFFKENGNLYKTGEIFKQKALAKTLRDVGKLGAEYLYKGAWAEKFVKAVQRDGGTITMEDMLSYRTGVNEPQKVSAYGYDFYGADAPINGADMILAVLKLLQIDGTHKLGHYTENAKALKRFSQALRYGDVVQGLTMGLMSPAQSKEIFGDDFDPQDIKSERNLELYWQAVDNGRYVPISTPASGTNHSDCIVCIDKEGNIAALTHSINTIHWGETGIFVDGFSVPDSAAFQQGALAVAGAGNRLPAPLPPIISFKDGQPFTATSAIGMGLINKSICVLYNILAFGMDMEKAQNTGAFHLADTAGALFGKPSDGGDVINKNYFDEKILQEARAMGLNIKDYRDAVLPVSHILGAPPLEGFLVGAMRKDGKNHAIASKWFNSVAAGE